MLVHILSASAFSGGLSFSSVPFGVSLFQGLRIYEIYCYYSSQAHRPGYLFLYTFCMCVASKFNQAHVLLFTLLSL